MASGELKRELVTTADGSHTIKVAELKEHYHSHKGALQESRYVFIEKGLRPFGKERPVKVLEVGFGTGLNALLTALASERGDIKYTALEPFPVDPDLINSLNYPALMANERASEVFRSIHNAEWGLVHQITDGFSIQKQNQTLQEFDSKEMFDLVYYDAFASHAQPELWEPSIWAKLYDLVADGGVLVTYCAKGQVRRDMQAAGFDMERLPGPPGKREMLRATKPPRR